MLYNNIKVSPVVHSKFLNNAFCSYINAIKILNF